MNQQEKIMDVSYKSFISSIVVMVSLMILAYIMTWLIPAGLFEREYAYGQELIVPGSYTPTEGGIPFWKWLLSPILILGSSSMSIIIICAFLMVVGGAFSALDECGVLRYMLGRLHDKFADTKYKLLFIIPLFFMLLGSFAGSFEDMVPLVPLVVALSFALGWDALIGLGMSILAVCCGFAAGVGNPFTVGLAQSLIGIPMLSGMWLRAIVFVIIYAMLMIFLYRYAKKIDKDPTKSLVYDEQKVNELGAERPETKREKHMDRAVIAFAGCLGMGVLSTICSTFITVLQNYMMFILLLAFLLAGTISSLLSGFSLKNYLKYFGKGIISFLPGIGIILMASSVRYTLENAQVLDTILYYFVKATENVPTGAIIIMIYLLILVMNFFITSATGKAFLLMPLIAPIAQLSGIESQVSVLAFAFGDGFSNIFYPTCPVLLICLGLTGVSYGKWARWSLKLQLPILVVTCGILLFAHAIGYQ